MAIKRIEVDLLRNLTLGYDKLSKEVGTTRYRHSIKINIAEAAKGFKNALKRVDNEYYQAAIKKSNYLKYWEIAIKESMIAFDKKSGIQSMMGSKYVKGAPDKPRILEAGRLSVIWSATEFTFDLRVGTKELDTQLNHLMKYWRTWVYARWKANSEDSGLITQTEGIQRFKTRSTGKGKNKIPGLPGTKGQKSWVGEEVAYHIGGGKDPGKEGEYYGTPVRHSAESTVGAGAIAKTFEDILADPIYSGLNIQAAITDLLEVIWASLGISWEEEYVWNNKTGKLEVTRVVRGEVKAEHITEPSDLKIIKKNKGIQRLNRIINKELRKSEFLTPENAPTFDASPTFAQQAARAAQYKLLRDLMLKNKKRATVKKVTPFKKPKPRQGIAKKPKRSPKPTYKSMSFAGKNPKRGKQSKGVEKGDGRQASTSQAADLARLRKYIQGRLPAEVRRNMGSPALRNITGRFSNSVQLLSLTQAPNTVMANYTYLLSPYQTFENTGRKRWPMAYNPKPLIAKSIRNLAQGRIEQKLTVRRV